LSLKRVFDLCFAAAGLVLLSPVLLLLAALVKLSDGGPVFFRQQRVGQGGQPFWIVKFRTMVVNAEKAGPQVTRDADPRITRIGRLMRKLKLDELPQLWNVLVGDMSFVGPRPEVPRYVERYTPAQRRVLELKPGITDPASLEFREEEEMLAAKAESGKQKAEMEPRSRGGTEDGGRKTEDGAERGDHRPLTTDHGRRTEEEVERFYVEYCVPRKIELSLAYAARANVWTDLKVLIATVVALRKS
jgi:lipopolysaccharide/colanic/teichoic acid biosynthesis glycosyltransferase